MTRRVLAIAFVVLAIVPSASGAQGQSEPDPSWQISHIRGGLYRVTAGPQVTVFFVTGNGIVLIDPLSSAVSRWLKREFADRFPGEPVRYVVYTHHHFERASGGGAFDDTAEHVAHDTFSRERTRSAATLPSALAALDRNHDGRLDRDELSGTSYASLLDVYDHNEDRRVTPVELYSYVRSPERTYRVRRTLTVNGKSVELIYTPTSHAADMTTVYFPTERILFAADFVPVRSMPPSIGPDPRSTIASLKLIEEVGFDTLLTSNGDEGTRADVRVLREYLEELAVGVRAAFNAGLTADETKRLVTLERFSSLSGFSTHREANIAQLYAGLRPVLTNLYGSTQLTLQRVQLEPCQAVLYDSCVSSSTFPTLGGAFGINVSLDRLTVGGEITSSQTKTTRLLATDTFFAPYEEVLQYRDTVGSFLVGYRLGRGSGPLVDVQGGLSLIATRSRLTAFSTTGSGSDGTETSMQLGPTFGANIMTPLGAKYSIVIPVRLTLVDRGRAEIHGVSFTAGAGLLVNVSRSSR